MAKLLAIYNRPPDAAAFARHYFEKHVSLAKKIPGLRSYQVSSGEVATADGNSPYHLVATLEFESMAAIQRALASPEGQAAAADLASFAQAGVELLMFDERAV